jgi:uncharacterized protein (UPF0276 family)
VWALLDAAYEQCSPQPTCLERDFNFPTLADLGAEVAQIAAIQRRHQQKAAA